MFTLTDKLQTMKATFLLIIVMFSFGFVGFSQTKSFLDVPYIEVNGYADTLVTPNEIFIRITLSEADTKDKISLEELEKRMVAGMKVLGINTEKELTTSNIQSNFRYYALKQKDVLKTKEYKLKVGDAVLATRVFMKLEELGIANAEVEKVGHSDITKIKNICRTRAILDAREKAISLTKPINQQIGGALLISDYSNDADGQVQVAKQDGLRMMRAGAESVALPQIDFEKIRITLTVAVKFLIK